MRASVYSPRRRLALSTDSKTYRSTSPHRFSFRRSNGVVRWRMMYNASSSENPDITPIPDSIPSSNVETDWRSFRAKLVSRNRPNEEQPAEWAHPLPAPELGCVLVAHPLMFTQQQTYFNLAVVFIFVHDHTGSAGLILNKQTRYTFGELDMSRNVTEGFEENPLYLGGDVGEESLNLLHKFKELENSIEVIDGVYLNGFEAAQKAVLRGTKNPNDFKWYARYCGWNPGQLEQECKNGVWFPAACSSELIVKEHSVIQQGPADLWHQVMQLMGGEYKDLSDVVIESSIKNNTAMSPRQDDNAP